ncbi:uncharacterized protein L969DRAFT_47420 [Mixia osmundae IAM 14324]|uniref:RING-type domain-containing protein n=1 Tax=Mixia osmundae (strain CBS 9802 / IAM 14324 / JCM 22182 / KY 12970) TaxID=764103 RepID=G7E8Y0_MIXOS|nr:uncharacterized protein L969DRAFT_47420 [Mixia osmundae IAM 14324]KEI40232.1 hypothetical protein L969DRAFT_47420 [Mixia osmundae IAM 14324]GAA99598.1 hypothetical protein E5Q_06299 [Mixia osmundae IAM 14324]
MLPKCGHLFHESCIRSWFQVWQRDNPNKTPCCPFCKTKTVRTTHFVRCHLQSCTLAASSPVRRSHSSPRASSPLREQVDAQDDVGDDHEATVANLRRSLKHANAKAAQLSTRLLQASEDGVSLAQSVLRLENETAKHQADSLRDLHRIDRLNDQLARQTVQLDKLRNRIADSRTEKKDAEEALAILRETHANEMRARNEEHNKHIQDSLVHEEELRVRLDAAERRQKEASHRANAIAHSVQAYSNRCDRYRRERDEARAEIASLRSRALSDSAIDSSLSISVKSGRGALSERTNLGPGVNTIMPAASSSKRRKQSENDLEADSSVADTSASVVLLDHKQGDDSLLVDDMAPDPESDLIMMDSFARQAIRMPPFMTFATQAIRPNDRPRPRPKAVVSGEPNHSRDGLSRTTIDRTSIDLTKGTIMLGPKRSRKIKQPTW